MEVQHGNVRPTVAKQDAFIWENDVADDNFAVPWDHGIFKVRYDGVANSGPPGVEYVLEEVGSRTFYGLRFREVVWCPLDASVEFSDPWTATWTADCHMWNLHDSSLPGYLGQETAPAPLSGGAIGPHPRKTQRKVFRDFIAANHP
jgi:hypothetical protein